MPPPTDAYRVLVADRQAERRSLTRRALEAGGLAVCAEAKDAHTAVAAALRERPDVCLLAVNIEHGGIFATREITSLLPGTAVVVVGPGERVDDALGALDAGAAGFLPDEMNPDRMARTLRSVLSGEAALPRRLVARLIEEFRRQGQRTRLARILRARGVELTRRQWDVLELLAEGMTSAEMAASLSITQATVRSHVATILRKLRVSTREAAVARFKGAFRSLNAQ
jgi:DNA-binding NarL/FixJ family response regulator